MFVAYQSFPRFQDLVAGLGTQWVGSRDPVSRVPSEAPGCACPKTRSEGGDGVAFSPLVKALRDAGVRLDQSVVRSSTQAVSFSFSLEDTHVRQVRADGQWDFHAQSLTVDFSFQAAVSVVDPESGEQSSRLFQFEFHLEAAQFQLSEAQDPVDARNDIVDFTDDVLKHLGKKMRPHGKGGPKGHGRHGGPKLPKKGDMEPWDDWDVSDPKKLLRAVASLVRHLMHLTPDAAKRTPVTETSSPDEGNPDSQGFAFAAEVVRMEWTFRQVSLASVLPESTEGTEKETVSEMAQAA